MGCCFGTPDKPPVLPDKPSPVSNKYNYVKATLYGVGGVLFVAGIAGLIVGSIATLGALPIAFACGLGIGGAFLGSISVLPGLLSIVNDAQKMNLDGSSYTDTQQELMLSAARREVLEAQQNANAKIIRFLEIALDGERDEIVRRRVEQELSNLRRRLESIEAMTLRHEMPRSFNADLAGDLHYIRNLAITGGDTKIAEGIPIASIDECIEVIA